MMYNIWTVFYYLLKARNLLLMTIAVLISIILRYILKHNFAMNMQYIPQYGITIKVYNIRSKSIKKYLFRAHKLLVMTRAVRIFIMLIMMVRERRANYFRLGRGVLTPTESLINSTEGKMVFLY